MPLENETAGQPRKILTLTNDPTAANGGLTGRPTCCKVYHISLPKLIVSGGRRSVFLIGCQQCCAKIICVVDCYTERGSQDASFVAAPPMHGIQTVIPQLEDIGNCTFWIRQLHG
jgi:hypothetical protein